MVITHYSLLITHYSEYKYPYHSNFKTDKKAQQSMSVDMSVDSRLGRFFGIPKNTCFFEEPVFRFCQTLNTEKPEKGEKSENGHKNGEPAHFRE